jgi:hypothetical protein
MAEDGAESAARSAGGVSSVCPDEGSEGDDHAVEHSDDDDDDGQAGVPACVS